jgi:hypothetical protein
MGLPGRQLSAADGQSEVDDKPGATAGNRQDAGEEEGRTDSLAVPPGTDVIPHLHGQIVPGRNYVYAAGFQLVWNEMWDRFVQDPPVLDPASEMAEMLNRRDIESADLDPQCYLVSCGYLHEGIIAKTRKKMAEKFPHAMFPFSDRTWDPGDPPRIYVYAHVEKTLAFQDPFERGDHGSFSYVPDGKSEPVKCPVESFFSYYSDQVKVLYYQFDRNVRRKQGEEFIVELQTKSPDDELLLARIAPQATMAETIAEVGRLRQEMAEKRKQLRADIERLGGADRGAHKKLTSRERLALEEREFYLNERLNYSSTTDYIIVPVIDFGICREFPELTGRTVVNHRGEAGAASVVSAMQVIRFKLDEKGVVFTEDVEMEEEECFEPRHFDFTGPFLLLLNERKSGKPVVAAWFGNHELLMPRHPSGR